MARVALVNLPFQADIESVAQTSVGPPLGLAYIAAVLRSSGHEVRLLDANVHRWGMGRIGDELRPFEPEVVGTTAATPSVRLAGVLAKMVKERLGRKVQMVVGGPHPTVMPEAVLNAWPEIDVAIVGEGELIADELIQRLSEGRELSGIEGIAWRASGGHTPRQGAIEVAPVGVPPQELDGLPFPARELLPNTSYHTIDARPMTCIVAIRGCPAGCSYCNVPALSGKRCRRRSPANVVSEIEECVSKYDVRFFSFVDDTFTTSREWTESLCRTLKDAGLGRRIRWSCLTRPDMVDQELLSSMKSAGCTRIEFGIESGSPRVLAFLNKGCRLPEIRKAFQMARKVGLATLGFAMVNVPGETPAEMEMTFKEVLEIDPDFLQLSFCTPYPGTALYEYCATRGLLATTDWSAYRFLKEPVVANQWLTPAKLKNAHARFLRSFYFRPGKLVRMARLLAGNRDGATALARTAATAALQLAGRLYR